MTTKPPSDRIEAQNLMLRQRLIRLKLITPAPSHSEVDVRICSRCESTFQVTPARWDRACAPCKPVRGAYQRWRH